MKFDLRAYLEKHILEGARHAIRATCAIPPPSNSTNSTRQAVLTKTGVTGKTVPHVAVVARVAAPPVQKQKIENPARDEPQTRKTFPHGFSIAGIR